MTFLVTIDWEGVHTIQGNECENQEDAVAYAEQRLKALHKIHKSYPSSRGKPQARVWQLVGVAHAEDKE